MKKTKKIVRKAKKDGLDFHDETTFLILSLGTFCILLAVFLILNPVSR